ncbi:MAG: YdcF family protein [Planctomycetes bacterium]|nr:YdcF family protein [Planctomycetota bacterium]
MVLGFLIVGFTFAGLYLARDRLLPAVARWLDVGETPQPSDCVMVMPGDENTRPFVAAAIVKAGLAERVLIPELMISPEVEEDIAPPVHETIRRVLRHRGVAEEDILILDGESDSTFGDTRALAAFLDASPQARVTVVTSDYHTRRTRWTINRLLGERARQVTFVSAPTEEFRFDAWWQVEEGFMAVVGEYLKLTYYVFRFTRIVYWIGGCAALAMIGLAYRRLRAAAA